MGGWASVELQAAIPHQGLSKSLTAWAVGREPMRHLAEEAHLRYFHTLGARGVSGLD